MTKQKFIERVQVVLNEAAAVISGDFEFTGEDTVRLPYLIEQVYPMAWRKAVEQFPRSWFENKSFADSRHIVDAPQGIGYVILPDDFYVLSSFKMHGWESACLFAPQETQAINNRQRNEHTRGTKYRPVCVKRLILHDGEFENVLYYYSLPKCADESTHVIEQALYIPLVTALCGCANCNKGVSNRGVCNTPLRINEKLVEPLVRLCAAEVLIVLEQPDFASVIAGSAK